MIMGSCLSPSDKPLLNVFPTAPLEANERMGSRLTSTALRKYRGHQDNRHRQGMRPRARRFLGLRLRTQTMIDLV